MSQGPGRVGHAIRPATSADDAFILGFVDRFSEFPLPPGRSRETVGAGVRGDLSRHLATRPAHSHFFVIEVDGAAAGFVHLLMDTDFFDGGATCHVSDLAIATDFEGRGLARALLAHADAFARASDCSRLTLSVFPGNERAQRLYLSQGFDVDLLRMGKPLGR
ncbi:GNAT family N-acetyltransferase [Marilutibacter aestuarii]|uniref:GNAT family N-acetyltransferase n=1 Tax=Marilutibacter aestuarii TaxID=1706195 RepID=A0A507ZZT2_9GAMM|nr:GNAT family N-acetyltransferase [Lysobacter aestuarii]TQD41208.1 GNAT family N-acetyltransferase [Lysobacter aestuarii]